MAQIYESDWDIYWLQHEARSHSQLQNRPKAELQIDFNHCATKTHSRLIADQKHMVFNYVGSEHFKSRTHVEIETVPKITHTQDR